jgi:hypothetical protein
MAEQNPGALASVVPNAGDQQSADTQAEIKKPSVLDDLQSERAKLYQIQAELMKQIEERSKPDPSAFWAAMARGFGNPATPSFAGGAAGFAGNLQAAQEEERKRAIETAQMRMQLAQAQLAMKRSDVIGQALFGEPPKEEPAVKGQIDSVAQAAGVSPNVARAMPPDLKKAVMLQWMQGDEKGAIETMAKFAQKNAEIPDELKVLENTISQFPPEQQPLVRKFYAMSKVFGSQEARLRLVLDIKDRIDQGKMTPKEGNSLINSMNPLENKTFPDSVVPPIAPAPAPKPAATGAPTGFPRVSAKDQRQRDADRTQLLSKELDQERQKLAAATTPDQRKIHEQNIESINRELRATGVSEKPTVEIAPSSLSPEAQRKLNAEIITKNVEAATAPFREKGSFILSNFMPQTIEQNKAELRELGKIANGNNKDVFGILQESGWINAAATAIAKGVQSPTGNYGMPAVEDFIGNLRLPREKRQALVRASQILGSQFLQNVKSNKGLLGVNPTDNDARLLQAPMANVSQTAASVLYWTQHQMNNQYAYESLFNSYNDYLKKYGKSADPSNYFTDINSGYNNTIRNWRGGYDTLVNKYAPF